MARFLLAVALCLCLSAASAAVTVTVDAQTGLTLGAQPEISSRLFGITAFEGFPSVVADPDYRARVAALRPGVFRFGAGVGWFAPPQYDPAWYDTPEAAKQFEQTLLFGNRYAFGRFPPVLRDLGAEAIFSFGHVPPYLLQEGSENPADFAKWAEMCAGFVGLWRKFDPGLRTVQVWNEPNASWFKDPRVKKGGPDATALHIEMARAVAQAIKRRFPEMQVGGPVLCWPPAWPPSQANAKPWYTWDMWTVPWLKATRDDLDFFDYHVYNVAPGDLQVQAEMVANAAQVLQGRALPQWITESNYDLKPTELNDPVAIWSKRFLPYERLLLRGILPQADKLAANLYHDLHAKNHTLLPRGADDPDPMYWLLWILRDLRGTRLVANADNPAVVTYATVEQDRVTVVLFNDSEASQDVALRLTLPGGWWTGPEVRGVGESAGKTCERIAPEVKLEHTTPGAVGTVQLPPHATVSLNLRLAYFHRPARQRVVTEAFGNQTLQFLQGTAPVRLTIPAPAAPASQRFLRLGLLGTTGAEQLRVTCNGQELPAQPTALQDLPLAGVELQPGNTVEVRLQAAADNPRLAVGFVSLVSIQDR